MSLRDVGGDNSSSTQLVIPISQFERDAAEGLTSSNFDLGENISANDTRDGLRDDDKQTVRNLMSEGHDFDAVCSLMNCM